jgi:transcriptional regulator with XRE-family HTH domain
MSIWLGAQDTRCVTARIQAHSIGQSGGIRSESDAIGTDRIRPEYATAIPTVSLPTLAAESRSYAPQEELAVRLDVSVRHMQRVEAGQKNISVKVCAELAPILKVQPAEFLVPLTTPNPPQGRPPRSR